MVDLVSSGVELMLIGMGIVFLFLTMLVYAINMMSALVQHFFPEAEATETIPVKQAGIDQSLVAAISAAVHSYRNPQQ